MQLTVAHSYLECTNWKFNDPNKPGFRDQDGTCQGYPRRFPVGRNRVFGSYDSIQFYRHYDQGDIAGPANYVAACSQVVESYTSSGNPSKRNTNISLAYAPNADIYGKTYGRMTQVKVGAELCLRWPSKNHAYHIFTDDNNKVTVSLNPYPNVAQDPSQLDFNANIVAVLKYRMCQQFIIDPAADQTYPGADKQSCGGCFTVPARAPGMYTLQWRWVFGNTTYADCSDVEIIPGDGSSENRRIGDLLNRPYSYPLMRNGAINDYDAAFWNYNSYSLTDMRPALGRPSRGFFLLRWSGVVFSFRTVLNASSTHFTHFELDSIGAPVGYLVVSLYYDSQFLFSSIPLNTFGLLWTTTSGSILPTDGIRTHILFNRIAIETKATFNAEVFVANFTLYTADRKKLSSVLFDYGNGFLNDHQPDPIPSAQQTVSSSICSCTFSFLIFIILCISSTWLSFYY